MNTHKTHSPPPTKISKDTNLAVLKDINFTNSQEEENKDINFTTSQQEENKRHQFYQFTRRGERMELARGGMKTLASRDKEAITSRMWIQLQKPKTNTHDNK